MYRPTWRMDDAFKEYVDAISEVTTLSAVQIARLALFAAPYSGLFTGELLGHRKKSLGDVSLPRPKWTPRASGLWLSEEWNSTREEDVANVHSNVIARIGSVEVTR